MLLLIYSSAELVVDRLSCIVHEAPYVPPQHLHNLHITLLSFVTSVVLNGLFHL